MPNDSFSSASSNIRNNDFNIIAIADVGCSLRGQENIKNIEKSDPELFLVAGDLSYKKTPDCWFNMTKSLDSKTKIAIGNHDDYEEEGMKGEKLKKVYMDYYGLDNSYYSFDYQNVHVLVLDTQLELSVDTLESTATINATNSIASDTTIYENKGEKKKKDIKEKSEKAVKKKEPLVDRFSSIPLVDLLREESVEIEIPELDKFVKSNATVPAIDVSKKQYQFVLDDLEKASQNKNIDWIFVMFHKPMYSSLSKQLEEYVIRDKYQEIFDKYEVDLVIQGHNHIYSRTLPLTFNNLNISQPLVDTTSTTDNNIFTNPNGTVFLVVGLGGEGIHRIVDNPYYIANHYNDGFGFVDIEIDGKRLDGKFYDINLSCKVEITDKKKKEVIDLESCLPSSTIESNGLKVVDEFSIIKNE